MRVWEEIEKLGYRVVFKEHREVAECNACYNVIYEGKKIQASNLKIPEGEIWISKAYKDFAEYILFHELQEIKHRAEGHTSDEAHQMALKDEEKQFRGNEKWKKLKREINVCTFESLKSTTGIGRELALRIIENRPYEKMSDLLKIPGIGRKRFEVLNRRFWCIEIEKSQE